MSCWSSGVWSYQPRHAYLLILTGGRLFAADRFAQTARRAGRARLREQIRAVLRADLELSGLFRIVDPATYIDEIPEPSTGYSIRTGQPLVPWVFLLVGCSVRRQSSSHWSLPYTTWCSSARVSMAGNMWGREQYREGSHPLQATLVFREFTGEDGPFNTQVVCVAPRRAGDKAKDILLMDYDGYGSQSLVADGALISPTLSPVGAILAYTSYRSGSPQIYLRHLSTGVDERLTWERAGPPRCLVA